MQLAYVVSSIWRGVSAHKGGVGDHVVNFGQHRRTAGLCLTRLDAALPATPDNLVLLDREEADELRLLSTKPWLLKYPCTAVWVASNQQRLKHLYG